MDSIEMTNAKTIKRDLLLASARAFCHANDCQSTGKDDVRIVGSSPCSKLAPVLASFSADLASELRKLVAIKVGCK